MLSIIPINEQTIKDFKISRKKFKPGPAFETIPPESWSRFKFFSQNLKNCSVSRHKL